MVTLNVTPAALAALSILLDINDDDMDEALLAAGIDPDGLAALRTCVTRAV